MNDHVAWILEVAVKPGQMESFRTLMEDMVSTTRTEPGVLNYEWFASDEDGVVHLHERYADSTAALQHLGNFGEKFAGRFLALASPTEFTVLGTPTDEAKAALAGFGPVYLQPFGGFTRATWDSPRGSPG
jgi:quinol monooxygenase YgiN